MSDCIFCKIITAEIPSHKVYEDDFGIAFLDIAPVKPGHVLVLPKKHLPTIEEASADDLAATIAIVKKIGKAIKGGLAVAGYNLALNNGPGTGQIVPHLHFHLIPRTPGDGLRSWPQGQYLPGEVEAVAEKIRKEIV